MSNTIFDTDGVEALGLTAMPFDEAKAVYDKEVDIIFNRISDLMLWFVRAKDDEDSLAEDALKQMMAKNEMSLLLLFNDPAGLNSILKGTLKTYDRIATDVCSFYQGYRQVNNVLLDVDTMYSRITDIGRYLNFGYDFHSRMGAMQLLGNLLAGDTARFQKHANLVQSVYQAYSERMLEAMSAQS